MTTNTELRRVLLAALEDRSDAQSIVTKLLPVIDRFCDEKVAESRQSGYEDAMNDLREFAGFGGRQLDLYIEMRLGTFTTYLDYANRHGLSHQSVRQAYERLEKSGGLPADAPRIKRLRRRRIDVSDTNSPQEM
ncbi:hypothetical protein NG701_07525 [Pseudarthrobacter sp. HLT3-5]|uniref:hypothetical protein n=1 Tax=Pseudarthrobacter cellobiosi TaxID=2953654 RepID=UPI00208FB6B2|nr:hypothetical protein [Pseudarthrobacter sp. HLT3-5]MCO4274278.1 hypothetical protein [Pseudarthrobacter sp. HLT3-5]